jgi:hypothetical protein
MHRSLFTPSTALTLFALQVSLAIAQSANTQEADVMEESGIGNVWWIALLIAVVAVCRWFVVWASGPDRL